MGAKIIVNAAYNAPIIPATAKLRETLFMVQKISDLKVSTVTNRLEIFFGIPTWQGRGKPLGSLVRTILSQSTNDRNRDMGFDRLKERFQNWDAVRLAPVSDIADAIRPAGLANQKSERIKNVLR